MKNKVLITTAISYTNGEPHVGHLYEIILANFYKRLYSLLGNETKLLTGTDEHGKKIEIKAKELNITPKELCDKYSNSFIEMNKKINSEYDYFIRTTDRNHIKLVQENLLLSANNNDLYLANYKGYYDVVNECFVSSKEVEDNNFTNPINNTKYTIVDEENFMFKLNKHKDNILKTLDKIYPIEFKTQILNRVENLEDLSISRVNLNWGIDFPNRLNKQSGNSHKVYVWFDALLNYITGCTVKYGNVVPDKIIHIIGQDILWFHSVIYPAILNSTNKTKYNPTHIITHGMILDNNGNKISKSLGNTIDINELLKEIDIEALKLYFILENNIGQNINFDVSKVKEKYNSLIINQYGNLAQRLLPLCNKVQDKINLSTKFNNIDFCCEVLEIENKLPDITIFKKLINRELDRGNKYITENRIWEKEEDELVKSLVIPLRCLFNASILLDCICPNIVSKIRAEFGLDEKGEINIKDYKKHVIFNRI